MKILFVSTFFGKTGGAENAALMEAELLRKFGHDVKLVSFKKEGNIQPDYYVPVNGLHDKTYVSKLGFFSKLKLLFQSFYNHEAFKVLSKAIEKEKPDLVHFHRVRSFSPSIYFAVKRSGIPLFVTLHDHYLTCPNSTRMFGKSEPCPLGCCRPTVALRNKCVRGSSVWTFVSLLEFYYRRLFVRDTKIVRQYILPSLFLLRWTERAGINSDKLTYLPNFIYNDDFDKPSTYEKCYVSYIGRLSSEKGIGTLLEAAKNMKDVKFQIIGDGPLRDYICSEIDRHGLDNVTLRGALYGNELRKARNASLVQVVTSECFENAPLVVLEAMASGLPVVGSNRGGIPELIEDGASGYLFEPGNSDDLEAKLRSVLDDDILRQKMGELGKELFATKFTAKKHLSDILRVYIC